LTYHPALGLVPQVSAPSVALVSWLVTASFGLVLLTYWIADGGRGGVRFAPVLIFGHFLLAGSGLIVWAAYLLFDDPLLAWLAFGDLVLVGLLGDFTLLRWLRVRRATRVAASRGLHRFNPDLSGRKAAIRFPVPVVIVHGVFAVSTLALVLVTALEIWET
jgi:hypothetical protein